MLLGGRTEVYEQVEVSKKLLSSNQMYGVQEEVITNGGSGPTRGCEPRNRLIQALAGKSLPALAAARR